MITRQVCYSIKKRRIKSELLFSIIDSFTEKGTHREDESSSTIDRRIDANQKEFNEWI